MIYRLQDKGVGKDAEWGSLLEKPPLRHADDTDSATLSHAVDIFVERHHLLWKVHAVDTHAMLTRALLSMLMYLPVVMHPSIHPFMHPINHFFTHLVSQSVSRSVNQSVSHQVCFTVV